MTAKDSPQENIAAEDRSAEGKSNLPDDLIVVLPVRNVVVFPGAVTQVGLVSRGPSEQSIRTGGVAAN